MALETAIPVVPWVQPLQAVPEQRLGPAVCRRHCRKSEQLLRLTPLPARRAIRPTKRPESKAISLHKGDAEECREVLLRELGVVIRPAGQHRVQIQEDKVSQGAILPQR
jgi:hypothetical protein